MKKKEKEEKKKKKKKTKIARISHRMFMLNIKPVYNCQ